MVSERGQFLLGSDALQDDLIFLHAEIPLVWRVDEETELVGFSRLDTLRTFRRIKSRGTGCHYLSAFIQELDHDADAAQVFVCGIDYTASDVPIRAFLRYFHILCV